MVKKYIIGMVISFLLLGCSMDRVPGLLQPEEPAREAAKETTSPANAAPLAVLTSTPTATEPPLVIPTIIPSSTPLPSPTPLPERVGPEEYPPNVSPLSGLQVKKPANLEYPPIMVSISNFPPSARPPAGLDWTPMVMEAYIGDGETRFLASFYGDYPTLGSASAPIAGGSADIPYLLTGQNISSSLDLRVVGDGFLLAVPTVLPPAAVTILPETRVLDGPGAGPVRSARIWYGEAAALNHAQLAFCHAWEGVLKQLSGNAYITVNPTNDNDINSAFIDVTRLESLAQNAPPNLQIRPGDLSGNVFDVTPPGGVLAQEDGSIQPVSAPAVNRSAQALAGKPADTVWIPWSNLSQIIWRYDPDSGAYNRYQDQADAKTFVRSIDRLNGAPLTYENLIILFANHVKVANYVYEIELMYITKFPAILFRDGKMYNIFWTTANGEYEKKTGRARPIRYIDENGDPIPLKPGQTWVSIIPIGERSSVHEIPPFDFNSKQAVRNLSVNFGPSAPEGMGSAAYQEKIFFATDMESRYPQRYTIKAEGSGTWIVPFSEASIQSP